VNKFLDLGRVGKSGWQRTILSVSIIIFFWQIIGAIPSILLVLLVSFDQDPQTVIDPSGRITGLNINIPFTAMMMASLAFLVGIFIAIEVIHERKLISLITSAGKISWKRIILGFLIWFFLLAFFSLLESLVYPGRYVFSLKIRTYLPFFALAICLIPIQTTAEELFFRGYLLQLIGLRAKNLYLLSIVSGLIFMFPHLLNPEAQINYLLMALNYFLIGTGLSYITLVDESLEAAIGVHAANNLFTALIANSKITVLPTPSIFTIQTLDPVYSLLATTVILMVFISLLFGPFRRIGKRAEIRDD